MIEEIRTGKPFEMYTRRTLKEGADDKKEENSQGRMGIF